MKARYFTALMIFCLSLVACQKNEDKKNDAPAPQNIATTPNTNNPGQCNLPGSTTCNPGIYQQNNWQTYQWTYNNGFCGCPAGYRPVMSQQYGLACAPNYTFNFQAYYYVGYGYRPSNNQWTNVPQMTYSPAISGSNNCYSQAIRTCDVTVPNSCGANNYCRSAGGASALGICTSGIGTDNYVHPVNPYFYPRYYPGYAYHQQPTNGRNCHYYNDSIFQGWYCYSYSSSTGGYRSR